MNKELQYLVYNTPEGAASVNAIVKDETIWLTQKAIAEYKKYKAKTLSNVEKDYLNSITMLEQKAKKANRIKAVSKEKRDE